MIQSQIALGYIPTPGNAPTASQALSAAATWLEMSFVGKAKTLNTLRVYVSAVTGSPSTSHINAHLQGDASGVPNGTDIEVRAIGAIGVGWQTFSGFTTALTSGVRYHIVFKNTHGTPASNSVTIRSLSQAPTMIGGGYSFYGWSRRTSTNSGSSWGTAAQNSSLRVGYSDGTFDGWPLESGALSGSADSVYSAREVGTWFVTPANVLLRVAGVSLMLGSNVGTVTGQMRARIYSGSSPSLLATTPALSPFGTITGNAPQEFYFDTVQELAESTIHRVVLGETTQSDTSANRIQMRTLTFDQNADSLAMLGWGSGYKRSYFDGSSWSDTAGEFVPFALLLDPVQPFASVGGGGSPIAGSIFGGSGVR